MDPESRACGTLKKRIARAEAARTLAVTRKYTDLPAGEVPALVELVTSARVDLPPLVQAKLVAWRSVTTLQALKQDISREENRKLAAEYASLHLLGEAETRNQDPKYDPRSPRWCDVVRAGLAKDDAINANPESDKDGLMDWEAGHQRCGCDCWVTVAILSFACHSSLIHTSWS